MRPRITRFGSSVRGRIVTKYRTLRNDAMTLSPTVRTMLICPVCHASLTEVEDSLACSSLQCGWIFPTVGGVPVLINQERSVFDVATFVEQTPTFFKPIGKVRQLISAWMPTLSCNVTGRVNFRHFREHFRRWTARPRVLVIGGSILGSGMEPLVEDPTIELIETDVALGPRTQLICDAHDLPFADETLDGVVVQAVLEHVLDPPRVLQEIYRVLKPGGLVYSDTPFMQQVHGREFDFTRFTQLGHRRLFHRFTELESGITCGPGVALAWSARYFLLSFFRGKRSRAIVSGLSRLAFFWLKYFDLYLVHKAAAMDAAAAFYFLGEKSRLVLSDRELIKSYRGGF
jgi:SAM-dependent methyltransferase